MTYKSYTWTTYYIAAAYAGEMWDAVSMRLYDDPYKVGVLLAANPELCGKVALDASDPIRVPILGAAETAARAPWRI